MATTGKAGVVGQDRRTRVCDAHDLWAKAATDVPVLVSIEVDVECFELEAHVAGQRVLDAPAQRIAETGGAVTITEANEAGPHRRTGGRSLV